MPEKPENFFEPGKPSHCIFSPDLDCDVYQPFSPFAPADFLCKVEPLTVGVILPSPEGEDGRIWDAVYERIAGVWQSRQVGFRCHRSTPEAWVLAKPCAACALTREAQVVILDVGGGTLRTQSFRDMANASTTTLQMIKVMNPLGSIPGKLVILISCGPMNLPPHILRAFHCVDYAGADGAPDLALLTREMEAIAHDASLFQEGDLLSLDFSDMDNKVQPPTTPAATAAAELSDDELVKFIPDTETSLPAPAEQKRRDALAEARKLVQKKSFATALRELQSVGDLLAAERAPWCELVSTCLGNLSSREIVDAFYGPGRDKRQPNLSGWNTEGALSSAILNVDDTGVARQIGAAKVPLYAFDRLETETVEVIYRSLAASSAGAKTAITVARECDEAAGRKLLEAGFSNPSLRLIEVRLADVEEQILARSSAIDHLRERNRPVYRRESDPFLEGIHRVVCGNEAFFGREELLEILAGSVRAGKSFMVFGLPRAGKSSLLRQVMLRGRADGDLPVLVDLQSDPPRQLSELYHLVVRSVLQAVSDLDTASERSLDVDLRHLRLFSLSATDPASRFRSSFVDDLGQLAADLPETGRLLLLFDELDLILPARRSLGIDGYRDFLEQLRILAGQDRCVLGIGGFCAALRHEISEGDCPLDGRVHGLPLGILTDEECSLMIRSLGRRTYSYFRDDALAAIRRASGCDPLLAKYLSSAVLETCSTGVGLVDEAAARRGIELFLRSPNLRRRLARTFSRYSDYFSSEARLLRQLAQESQDDRVDLTSFRKDRHVQESWLKNLSDYGLIARLGTDQISIHGGLLREWLRQESER
jgi:hypothetical protein